MSINITQASFYHTAYFNKWISVSETTPPSTKVFTDYIPTDHYIYIWADAYVANTNEARLTTQASFTPIGDNMFGGQASTFSGHNYDYFNATQQRFFKEGTASITFIAEKLQIPGYVYGCSAYGTADIHW